MPLVRLLPMRSILLAFVASATAFGAASTGLGDAASPSFSPRSCDLGPLQLRILESDARSARLEVVAADSLTDVSVHAALPGGEALVLAGALGLLEAGERRLVDVRFQYGHGVTDGLLGIVTAEARLLEADVPSETVAVQTGVVLRAGRFASEAVPVQSARGASLDVPLASGGAR